MRHACSVRCAVAGRIFADRRLPRYLRQAMKNAVDHFAAFTNMLSITAGEINYGGRK
jgi:hypothetical protein